MHPISGIVYRDVPQALSKAGTLDAKASRLEITQAQAEKWTRKMGGKPLMLRHNGSLRGNPGTINKDAVVGKIIRGYLHKREDDGTTDLMIDALINADDPVGKFASELVRSKSAYQLSARHDGAERNEEDQFMEASIVFDGAREGCDIVLGTAKKDEPHTADAGGHEVISLASAMQTIPSAEEQIRRQMAEQLPQAPGSSNVGAAVMGEFERSLPPSLKQQQPPQQQQQPPQPAKPQPIRTGDPQIDALLENATPEQAEKILAYGTTMQQQAAAARQAAAAATAAAERVSREAAATIAEQVSRVKNGKSEPLLKRRTDDIQQASAFFATETGKELLESTRELADLRQQLTLQQQQQQQQPASTPQAVQLADKIQAYQAMLASTKPTGGSSFGVSAPPALSPQQIQHFSQYPQLQQQLLQQQQQQSAFGSGAGAGSGSWQAPQLQQQQQQPIAWQQTPPTWQQQQQPWQAPPPQQQQQQPGAFGFAAAPAPALGDASAEFKEFQRWKAFKEAESSGHGRSRDPSTGQFVSASGFTGGSGPVAVTGCAFRIPGVAKMVWGDTASRDLLLQQARDTVVLASAAPEPFDDRAVDRGEKILILDSPLAPDNCPAVVIPPEMLKLLGEAAAQRPGTGFSLVGRFREQAGRRGESAARRTRA